ncbi:MAG: exodeoxyribonuclease VII large subunit [Thermodesulfobacteriota bacterium]
MKNFTQPGDRVQSVSELTSSLKGLLESHYSFVTIVGEISNLRVPYSGHHYFILKDSKAQIKAVMFKGQLRYLTKGLADGQHVLARGRITVYEPRGDYQIVIDSITPQGEGELQLAMERLKAKLAAKGFFAPERKRPLPALITKICLITSPSGAAIHDFLKVAQARFSNLEVELLPVRVQGEGAAAEMVRAIKLANRRHWAQVIILTRGGGSLEDLWAFNDEGLAESIAASRLPLVSAVGHEIDFTIADFAADLRAPTPSAAAEMVVADKEQLARQLLLQRRRLARVVAGRIGQGSQMLAFHKERLRGVRGTINHHGLRLDHRLHNLSQAMAGVIEQYRQGLKSRHNRLRYSSPLAILPLKQQRCREMRGRLAAAMAALLGEQRLRLARNATRLDSLSPLAILARGYSLTFDSENKIIHSVAQVKEGDEIRQQLSDGTLLSRVERVRPD